MLENTLTAQALIRNKGIRFETWEKWDKTMEMLPRTGQKQYEPNNSWLQNKQIEKGLKDRKDLLGIERVERGSQLASAEWLPQESRARVTKKSGQEWTSFGLEENLGLYLIPEEALLLLELNRLELTWAGVALSIQQAYSVLLGSDRSACNIDEYRVYSHLVRQGYRLQRFHYKDGTTPHDRSIRPWGLPASKRKKLIHDPLDCFGMTRDRIRVPTDDETIKGCLTATTGVSSELQPTHETAVNPDSYHVVHGETTRQLHKYKMTDPSSADKELENGSPTCERRLNIGNEGRNTTRGLDVPTPPFSENEKHTTDNTSGVKKLPSELYDNGVLNLPGPSNVEAKNSVKSSGKNSKLKIISDETLLGEFKIISKWPGTRVQRNVKLMPKRYAGGTLPLSIEKINDNTGRIENCTYSASASPAVTTRSGIGRVSPSFSGIATNVDNSNGQKRVRTHEIIEVSDDEIEEVPLKMSRMEMLNLFPNTISESFVAKQISRKYLPLNIWPQKKLYQNVKKKVSSEDLRKSSNVYDITCVESAVNSSWARDAARSTIPDERLRQNVSTNILFSGFEPRLRNVAAGQIPHRNPISWCGTTPVTNINGTSVNCRKEISRPSSGFHRDSFETRTMYQRSCNQVAPWATQTNKEVARDQEHLSVQLGLYTNVAVAQSIRGKSPFFKRGLLHRQNLPTNMSYYHSKQNLVNFMPQTLYCNTVSEFSNTTRQRPLNNLRYLSNNNSPNSRKETGEPSFKVVPGASSWAETKARWLDEKTITIEDEDFENYEDTMVDESEVKIVARPVRPLVGRQNATSLAQVCNRLQIIKPAAGENFRWLRKVKQTDSYKISYNLYSMSQQYKKANPGIPMYRVVVIRSKDTPFIELAEIVRLQKDANQTPIVLAYVSQTSVTFAELGTVRIPDIQNNYSER